MTEPTHPTRPNVRVARGGGFDPASVLDRFSPSEILDFIGHMHDQHGGGDPYLLGDCNTCMASVLSWLDRGLITLTELLDSQVGHPFTTPTPAAPGGRDLDRNTEMMQAMDRFAGTRPTPAPALAAARPGAGDVLAAVDEQGRMLCACGCGVIVDDNSPSAYFATQACSDLWHAEQLDDASLAMLITDNDRNPTQAQLDEYQRRFAGRLTPSQQDAVDYLVRDWTAAIGGDVDHTVAHSRLRPTTRQAHNAPATAWLGQISTRWEPATTIHAADTSDDPVVTVTVRLPQATPRVRVGHDVVYRVFCESCHSYVTTVLSSTAHASQRVSMADVRQSCASCAAPIPGRPMLGWTELHHRAGGRDRLRFYLEDGYASARDELTLIGPVVPLDVEEVWQRLQRQLDEFATRRPAPAAPGDDVPYLLDVPPRPRTRPILPWHVARRQ